MNNEMRADMVTNPLIGTDAKNGDTNTNKLTSRIIVTVRILENSQGHHWNKHQSTCTFCEGGPNPDTDRGQFLLVELHTVSTTPRNK